MNTTSKDDMKAKFVDAALAALMMLIVGLPLLGLTTVDSGGTLQVQTRWSWLFSAAASVFIFRAFILKWFIRGEKLKPASSEQVDATPTPRATTYLGFALGVVAIGIPFVFFDNRYIIDVSTTVLIYVLLGWGLNIVVGLAGLLDLGYVAFYAVGAYSYAVLSTHFDFSFWLSIPMAGALAAIFGVLLGYPTLRLRGDYLAIVTLGFGEIIRIVLINWTDLTNGPNGITSIPRPSFFGLPFSSSEDINTFSSFFGLDYSVWHRTVFLYALILVMAVTINLVVLRLRHLPIGRAWEAMREDEIACKALGINVTNVKLSAFALGAMVGGIAGIFFAARQGFISPESFTFGESATILAIVVLGGSGSQLGVVLAACLLVLLPELGRSFAEYRMLVFGAAMVVIMIVKPSGLLSQRKSTISVEKLKQGGIVQSTNLKGACQ
ncbi:high-affinity branched-chain amino acid ABC transporter permease LivM [Rhodoferax sp. GW822-FHT02A01]|uniref:high-affinity branched-chain amino acid ABC transporter permease LivM n=1 Tax=Rhodoferax sp. GW822-FHT02A01 TaxID=3141537 RepID=UPI00315C6871